LFQTVFYQFLTITIVKGDFSQSRMPAFIPRSAYDCVHGRIRYLYYLTYHIYVLGGICGVVI